LGRGWGTGRSKRANLLFQKDQRALFYPTFHHNKAITPQPQILVKQYCKKTWFFESFFLMSAARFENRTNVISVAIWPNLWTTGIFGKTEKDKRGPFFFEMRK
jgi:hypothetical protein